MAGASLNGEKIFLVGLPLSGKTTRARRLAIHVGGELFDTDDEIERQERQSIADLFSSKGERYFREREHEMILSVGELKGRWVIATGGGLPCFFNHMSLMLSWGTVFYLHLSWTDMWQRLCAQKGVQARPLLELSVSGKEEGVQLLKNRFASRLRTYERAHVVVEQGEDVCDVYDGMS